MKTDWCLKSIKTKLSKVHSRPYLNCDLLLFSRVLQLRTSLSAFSCTSKFYKIAIFLQIPMCFHNKSPKNLSFTYQRTFVRQSTILPQFIFFLSFNQSQHTSISTRILENNVFLSSRKSLPTVAKGQLISKANSLVLIWTKNPTKLFFDFCPSL